MGFPVASYDAMIAAEAAAELSEPQAVRDAVRNELIPWALDYSDPVKERVEARRQEAAERE